jgi:hypothetical protein
MAAAAKAGQTPVPQPLFIDGPLPAPTTPGDQYLAAILGELCAIREILMATAPPARTDGLVELREKEKPRRR